MPLCVAHRTVEMTNVGPLGPVASVPFSHGVYLKPHPVASFPSQKRPDLRSHAPTTLRALGHHEVALECPSLIPWGLQTENFQWAKGRNLRVPGYSSC